MATTTTASECDWTNLPNHLLGLIAERLTLVDYIRFGAVCSSWASTLALSSAGGQRFYRPNYATQSPWLMLPGEDLEFSCSCTFFNVSDHKSYKFSSMPELHGKWWVSSTEGWVVTLNEVCRLFLFNPLTKAQIQLPFITTIPQLEVIHNLRGPRCYLYNGSEIRRDIFRVHSFQKVVLSAAAAAAAVHDDYIAMAIFHRQDLIFTKAGDEKWTALDHNRRGFDDVIYHEGKFYSISREAEVRAWDLSGSSPIVTIVSNEIGFGPYSSKNYLVGSSSGDLLQVWRNNRWDQSTKRFTKTEVGIFKFKPRGCEWIQVSSLGDRCLFLGLGHSMFLSTRDIPGLMCNCIYFTDFYWSERHSEDTPCNMGVFNLEDGSFKPFHSSDFQRYWPLPLWIMPTLC